MAGVVPFFQQLFRCAVIGPAQHKGKNAAGNQHQQNTNRRIHHDSAVHHHGHKQRNSGQNAQHGAGQVQFIIGGTVRRLAFPHHAGHAVFCFKGFLFQKIKVPVLRAAQHKQHHSHAYHYQQNTQANTGRHILVQAKLGMLADFAQKQHHNR